MNALDSLKDIVSYVDLNSEAAYDILFKAFTEQYGMPIFVFIIPKGSFLFRSRNNNGNSNYIKFSDLSFPGVEHIRSYSRCNKPGQQVFYASDSYETTLAELLPLWSKDIPIGELFFVTTGKWKLIEDITVSVIPDFTNERMKIFMSKVPDNKYEYNINYWGYINSFFKSPDDTAIKYKFTSAFCNAMIHNSNLMGNKVEGVLYTSVQDASGWNIAIEPGAAKSKLVLKDVIKHSLKKNGFKNRKAVYDNFSGAISPIAVDEKLERIIW